MIAIHDTVMETMNVSKQWETEIIFMVIMRINENVLEKFQTISIRFFVVK